MCPKVEQVSWFRRSKDPRGIIVDDRAYESRFLKHCLFVHVAIFCGPFE